MTTKRDDKLDYEQFESVCNKILTNMAGLGIHDIEDATWRDYYNDGLSPLNAVNSAIEDSQDDDLENFIWYGE